MANQHEQLWTDQDFITAKKVLADSEYLDDAASRLSVLLKRPISNSSLRGAFARAGEASAGSFLKKEVGVSPTERFEYKERKSREREALESMVKELRDYKVRQEFLDRVSVQKEPPRIMARERSSGLRELTGIVLISDLHVEEPVDPEAVAGMNEYNLDIAGKRLDRLFNGVIWNYEHHRVSKRLAIRDLVLWLGGDLMTGYIHDELIENNELSPTETILWLLPRLRNGIHTLLNTLKLDSIVIPCSYGNHGRTTKKKQIATGYKNSYEWLMYHVLASYFKDEKRVRFEITKSPHQYVQTYEFMNHFHHGDSLKYGGGVGGLGIPLLKRLPKWDSLKRSHYHNIGHFHQNLDFGRVHVNGSLIGYNPYAQEIGAEFEAPSQLMYYVDKSRGKCFKTEIWVDDSKPGSK